MVQRHSKWRPSGDTCFVDSSLTSNRLGDWRVSLPFHCNNSSRSPVDWDPWMSITGGFKPASGAFCLINMAHDRTPGGFPGYLSIGPFAIPISRSAPCVIVSQCAWSDLIYPTIIVGTTWRGFNRSVGVILRQPPMSWPSRSDRLASYRTIYAYRDVPSLVPARLRSILRRRGLRRNRNLVGVDEVDKVDPESWCAIQSLSKDCRESILHT